MEGAVMAWIEAERRQSVTPDDVAAVFGWPRHSIWYVLRRLAIKGWLRRTSRGRYETVLAETGGFAPANPWAALSTWGQAYYVGFQSAAYELGLTPDRPGDVQACVRFGAHRPRAWEDTPIALIHLRSFSLEGVERRDLHGWDVAVAAPEKVVVDGAAVQSRVGGVSGLARVVSRAAEDLDWTRVVEISETLARGRAATRRLAALLELLELPVPSALAERAEIRGRSRALSLGDPHHHGLDGPTLERWGVIANVDLDGLREELRR
jgi:predicted transcriptional regulator of viral defense system